MPINSHQKDIVVLSFHNTLYPNPQRDTFDEISPRLITRAKDFFYELYTQSLFPQQLNLFVVLICKNESAQAQAICSMLHEKGYPFHETFFNPLDHCFNPLYSKHINPQLYEISFFLWKQSIITMYNLCSSKKSLTVIESDIAVCQMAQRLGIRAIHSDYMLIDEEYHVVFRESSPSYPELFEFCHPYYESLWQKHHKARQQQEASALHII